MHIGGEAPADKLAAGVRAIFDKVKEIRAANRQPAKSFGFSALPEKSSIDGEAICQVFGQKGDANNGMYKITVGREVKMPCGCDVGSSMGVNTKESKQLSTRSRSQQTNEVEVEARTEI